MARLISAAAVLAAGGLTAACATVGAPPGPTTQFARSDCAAAPDLTSPISLTPEKERASHVVAAQVARTGACLARDGHAAPYAVFALPADHEDKTIAVGGVLEATRIFAPSVTLLDRTGAVTRSFAREDYYYRGAVYSVQFRPRPDEAYLLVAADPALVGKRYDSVAIGTSTTVVSTGYATATWTSGVDTSLSRTFSYEGAVQVTVSDSDIKEGR